MELSWTTFFLEIVNFLVLVWILKRFLYKPVLDIIAKRREAVEKTMADAEAAKAEAARLKSDYEGRLAEAAREKERAREALQKEIDADRARLLAKLKADIAAEEEKLRAVNEKKLDNALRQNEERALSLGAAFVARLMSQVADEGLHRKLVVIAFDQLSRLSKDKREALQAAFNGAQGRAQVSSPYAFADEEKRALEEKLRAILGTDVKFDYSKDESLKAGLRVIVGPWVLHANLEDELKSFVDSTHESD